jgi:signal transduction histidine kinase
MTFAGKIRLFLIIAALLPPLVILTVVYFHGLQQLETTRRQTANDSLEKFFAFDNAFKVELERNAGQLIESEMIRRATLLIETGRAAEVDIAGRPTGFDFVELVDTNLIVRASMHRGGLIGNKIHESMEPRLNRKAAFYETVEFDVDGRHAAVAYLAPVDEETSLFCGWYLNRQYLDMIRGVIAAEVNLYFQLEEIPDLPRPEAMLQMTLYKGDNDLHALIIGGSFSGYYVMARFRDEPGAGLLWDTLKVTGGVGLVAIIIAIVMGVYITGKAKREINNLIRATERVSHGDFDTAIMAYEEGEFDQLADSFSAMVTNLKRLRQQLATTEKIAAWKIVGQKVAHEIKNPLTPITISVDDLKRSYHEDREDFEKILNETTTTIKNELTRMTKMLNEFTAFARMNPPEIREVALQSWLESVTTLYKNEVENGRLTIANNSKSETIRVDPESLEQVMVNLIKNGLESDRETVVTVTINDGGDGIVINVDDNGPGFTNEILAGAFTPYLTTKEKGSGLGLAICQRIIHDHGGTIELTNKTEGGARVIIYLPR